MRRPILVVEDNPHDAELLQIALELARTTHPVVSVVDGREALDYLKREGVYADCDDPSPEFVLLDIKTPRVNGFEVLQEMRGTRGLREIPVVILSSSREPRDIENAYDLGVNSYLVKPTDFTDFARNIATVSSMFGRLNEIPPSFRTRVDPRH